MEYKKKFSMSIWPTIITLAILALSFVIGAWRVRDISIDNCLDTLSDSAEQFALSVKRSLESDRRELEMIADILSGYEDIASEDARRNLVAIEQPEEQAAICLLLPDNTLLSFWGGICEETAHELNFEEEALRGHYVAAEIDPETHKGHYLYQMVPVEKDGEVRGILYKVTDLEKYQKVQTTKIFGGKSLLHIVDAETGDFIVSSWNNMDNIYDSSIEGLKIVSDYDYNQWLNSLKNGQPDYIEACLEDSEEHFYTFSQPVGINKWIIMLSIPESVVFENVKHIHHVLEFLAIMNGTLLIIYFIGIIFRIHSEIAQNQKQIKNLSYMYDVQKSLFDSHRRPESMEEALEKAGRMLTASTAFLCALDNEKVTAIYQWTEEEADEESAVVGIDFQRMFGKASARLKQGERVLIDLRNRKAPITNTGRAVMKGYGISSVVLVPICDTEEKLIGVLGAMNMQQQWNDAALLEGTAWNFMMALKNLEVYQKNKRMGSFDTLTGLKNRNCYENNLPGYAKCVSEEGVQFGCVYIDVNGLHELNNTDGHAAGDAMLQCVGDIVLEMFGSENAYRTGGDEFIVFCPDGSKEKVEVQIAEIEEFLCTHGYCISVGTAWSEGCAELKNLILEAEQKMYAEKRRYYEENGAGKDRRRQYD